MPDVREKQREARRKIIRQWATLPKDKRQSMEGISEFARTAAQQNEKAFVRSRRDPYEKIMGWLLPRAHLWTTEPSAHPSKVTLRTGYTGHEPLLGIDRRVVVKVRARGFGTLWGVGCYPHSAPGYSQRPTTLFWLLVLDVLLSFIGTPLVRRLVQSQANLEAANPAPLLWRSLLT
jgi:hypothetical protein